MITLGLFGINMGPCAEPDAAARIAVLAEELGYDTVWAGEHVVAPSPRVPPSPIEPDLPILDPVVSLTYLAAVTRRVRLATGIVILPQRNPVVLAKQLASLDVLSGGRLVFGLGVGYVEPELRAVGVPMAGRGARADEYLAAMRALWDDEKPEFHGETVSFSGVDAHPRPVQRPIPVFVGGHSASARRRAVRHADGWYGFMLDRERTAAQVAALRAAGGDGLTIVVSPSERLDASVVADYAALGVDHLVVVPPARFWRPGGQVVDFEEFVRANAPA
ncbi:LLM class F420-dependent oxidoreductase [Saccharothrix sp. ALI-22-I]|uniref:LLM class F420-dependent oxidoreductase n=1 Tax=Saccharothrix sp. ALI-22-I TaxID=1933778 RepID=UPI001930EFF6|nr:LLM class F420-dependent oxidoreductase [Saccharothrix sp. ALI-22-I]